MMGYVSRQQLQEMQARDPKQHDQFMAEHLVLGEHPDSHDMLFLPEVDRYSGTYIIGMPGNGKSSQIANMVYDDAVKGNAIIVIDPHGDLISDCLAQLPEQRIAHTYVLDMEDEAYPFGVNLFTHGVMKTEAERTQTIDRITHVFDVLWPEVAGQQYLGMYLRMAIIALLATPGSTIVDLLKFLLDETFRASILRSADVDYSVRNWWQTEYEALKPEARKTRVQSLLNRLYTLFMGRSLVRNVIGQRKTTISFRRAIENREIIFVRLPLKTLKQDGELIGMVIVAQIHAALFSFGNIPEAQRPGFSLYIDEFQHFVTKDIEEMITEGRKYKVRLTVAHQFRDQLSADLQKPTLATLTKIVFQTTIEDGPKLAPLFPLENDTIKLEDLEDQPCAHLLKHGSTNPLVRRFVEYYLRPLQVHRRGKKVKIQGLQWTPNLNPFKLRSVEDWNRPILTSFEEVEVDDPITYLDPLLLEVMKTKNPNLFIPAPVPLGFSNAGHRFYQQALRAEQYGVLRMPVPYPAQMIVQGENRNWWLIEPRNSVEQMYHFTFHLRETMAWLAFNPIGKISRITPSEVGQRLSHLPKRHAYVRTDQDFGMIHTLNTPARLDGAATAGTPGAHYKPDANQVLSCPQRDRTPPQHRASQRTIGRWRSHTSYQRIR